MDPPPRRPVNSTAHRRRPGTGAERPITTAPPGDSRARQTHSLPCHLPQPAGLAGRDPAGATGVPYRRQRFRQDHTRPRHPDALAQGTLSVRWHTAKASDQARTRASVRSGEEADDTRFCRRPPRGWGITWETSCWWINPLSAKPRVPIRRFISARLMIFVTCSRNPRPRGNAAMRAALSASIRAQGNANAAAAPVLRKSRCSFLATFSSAARNAMAAAISRHILEVRTSRRRNRE